MGKWDIKIEKKRHISKYRNFLGRRKNISWLTFLLPSLLGTGVFAVLPYLDVVKRSFSTAVTGEWSGINNYTSIFQNRAFQLAAWNTLRFSAVCLPLLIVIGLLAANGFCSLPKIKGIQTVYLLPMAVPSATVVLVWKLTFDKSGFLNSFLGQMAFLWERVKDAGMPAFLHTDYMNTGAAFGVLVFSYIWKNLGYTIVLWMTGLTSIPEELKEAARVDGAKNWQVFRYVCIPHLLPTLFTIAVLSFLNSFKIFREAYLVAGAYPHDSIYMLQHLFNNWFLIMELDKMAAGAVVTGVVIMAGILLLQRLWEVRDN